MTTEYERRLQIEEGRRMAASSPEFDQRDMINALAPRRPTLTMPGGTYEKRLSDSQAAREASQQRPERTKREKPRADQPKGHEAYLEALRASGAIVEVRMAGDTVPIHGKLKSCDKFTITLLVKEFNAGHAQTRALTFFKHALAYFGPVGESK